MKSDRADIVVYTLAFDDEPGAQLHSRVVVNGREIPAINHIRVDAKGADLTVAKLWLTPSTIKFVSLSSDEWNTTRDLSHSPSPEVMRELLTEAIEAFRITREYVGADVMKDEEGWQWSDWCARAREFLKEVD